jgi:PAB-dependent poly(A)-specific ribonuclease subunit 3
MTLVPVSKVNLILCLNQASAEWNHSTKHFRVPLSGNQFVFLSFVIRYFVTIFGHSPLPTQLNYHLYTPASHLSNLPKSDHPQASFFMSDSLRQELTQRSEALRAVPVPSSSNLPDELQGYHTLVLLDQLPPSGGPATKDRRPNFGPWHSSVYKATSSTDGLTYVLRRIESMSLHDLRLSSVFVHSSGFLEQIFDCLTSLRLEPLNIGLASDILTSFLSEKHSQLELLTTIVRKSPHLETPIDTLRGSIALIVSYDYHPNAVTLFDAHLKIPRRTHSTGLSNHISATTLIPEPVMWTYITQIGNAIRTVHALGLAVRMIDATKILLIGKNR